MTAIPMPGCFDLNTAPAVQRDLMDRLGAEPRLRLDMSAVTWIDSAGLASLVQLLAEARRRGGDLVLDSVSDGVRRMLRLARLEPLFPAAR